MLIPVPPTDCMRAREAVSVRLDGELCELDEVRLDQHLTGCADCSRFAADAARTAQVLRGTPLVTAPLAPFVARRRYAVRVPFAAAAAVMLIAATSGSLFFVGRFVGGSSSAAGRTPPAITAPRQPGGLEIGDIAMLRNAGPLSRGRGLVPV